MVSLHHFTCDVSAVITVGTCPTGQQEMLNGGEHSAERHIGGWFPVLQTWMGSFHLILEVFSNSATLNNEAL